jgi:hypothetical protein
MVSAGAIASGQGTEKIEIDTAETQGQTVTATVEIGGGPRECLMVNSHTVEVLSNPAALKVYEGRYVSHAELEKQIDELILARIVTQGNGYLIFYPGRRTQAPDCRGNRSDKKEQSRCRAVCHHRRRDARDHGFRILGGIPGRRPAATEP